MVCIAHKQVHVQNESGVKKIITVTSLNIIIKKEALNPLGSYSAGNELQPANRLHSEKVKLVLICH